MTWLYVPGTSSPSAQVSEGLNSASLSLSDYSVNALVVSATWKGKPLQPQAWLRQWKRGGFIRRLSGLTCSPSTLEHGVASFISSLREIPAKTTPLQENERAKTASDSSLPKSSVSPKSAGLLLSSARTSRGTRTDSSRPSSRHWKDWATALRQEYSVRPKPETPCAASDCSSWPSPTVKSEAQTSANPTPGQTGGDTLKGVAQEWMAPVADDTGTRSKRYGQGGMALSMQASQWEAPSVAVTEGSRMTRGGDRSNELLLTGQAIALSEKLHWPGPAARDHKGTNSAHHLEVSTGSLHLDQLPNFVEHCFRLPSSPDQPIAGGSMSSTDSPNSNQHSAKRKLNPIFVEALMRWPTGLSGFERQATVLIPSLQPTPFCVCDRGYQNDPNKNVSALRQGNAQTSKAFTETLGQAPLVRPILHDGRQGSEAEALPALRSKFHSHEQQEARDAVLLNPMREPRAADQRAISENACGREGSHSAPGCEGGGTGQAASLNGDRSSLGSREAEQCPVELGGNEQLSAFGRAHERQPTCAPLSAYDRWWMMMLPFVSALCSATPEAKQMELFAA